MTKTQIDRLGDRLRKGNITEEDLQLLDSYRRSFSDAYEHVLQEVRERLGRESTGRPAKSTTSVIDKLRRESIRLSQIQDIAGCRIVVLNIAEQDLVVARLRELFPTTDVVDRRKTPSHGYRAVHVIVSVDAKLVEIQVRTMLQHLWAEVSEKLSDVIDPAIKYGGGPQGPASGLSIMSDEVAKVERGETSNASIAVLLELLLIGDITYSPNSNDVLPD